MPVKFGIASREISTEKFYPRFEPPLIFHTPSRLVDSEGTELYIQLVHQIGNGNAELELAQKVFFAFVRKVHNEGGEDVFLAVEDVERWYSDLAEVFGRSAEDVFITMTYRLVSHYLDVKKKLSVMREIQQVQSSTTSESKQKERK